LSAKWIFLGLIKFNPTKSSLITHDKDFKENVFKL